MRNFHPRALWIVILVLRYFENTWGSI